MLSTACKKNNRFNVCWDITSNCNEHCHFCYRNPSDGDLSVEKNYRILTNLIDNGAEKITFTGGEPLLYVDLFRLVQQGKRYSDHIVFSLITNGILLANWDEKTQGFSIDESTIDEIATYFDWITLPLDAPNNVMQQNVTRNAQHFERTITLIDYIKLNYPRLKIKINTLVSHVNYQSVPVLFELLKSKNIQRWKLFNFMPSRGIALQNKNRFYIPENLFDHVCSGLDVDSAPNIEVSFVSYEQFKNAYFYVSTDGYLVKFDGQTYRKIANCQEKFNSYILSEIYQLSNYQSFSKKFPNI